MPLRTSRTDFASARERIEREGKSVARECNGWVQLSSHGPSAGRTNCTFPVSLKQCRRVKGAGGRAKEGWGKVGNDMKGTEGVPTRGEGKKRNGLDDCCSLQRNSIQVERALRSLAFNWEPRGEKGRGGREREGGRVSYLPLQTAHRNDQSTGSFKYFNNLLYREWRFEYLAVPRYAQNGGGICSLCRSKYVWNARLWGYRSQLRPDSNRKRESLFSRKNFVEQLSRY